MPKLSSGLRYKLYNEDCRKVMARLPRHSFDSIVTDPPYGLSFMGSSWDKGVPGVEFWSLALRVAKPGAMMLCFGGTRTYHRLAVAIEDAGWELVDCCMWLYGCLSDDTEILVNGEWVHYSKAIAGSLALCYDAVHDTYSWQAIENLYVYPYEDTAYRIQSDRTDQIVSKNHRCIVKQCGKNVFREAESLAQEHEICVPVLETLQRLLNDLPLSNSGTSIKKPSLSKMCGNSAKAAQRKQAISGKIWNVAGELCCLQKDSMETKSVVKENSRANMLKAMQRNTSRKGMGKARLQSKSSVVQRSRGIIQTKDERKKQSIMERRSNLFQEKGKLQAYKVCEVSKGISSNGSQGWLCNDPSAKGSEDIRKVFTKSRSGTPRRSQSIKQQEKESIIVCKQPSTQAIRALWYTTTSMARITPIDYKGIVWCVKVPTGAFVARRNGKVFVTGNSGFPKGTDISAGLDKRMGKKREEIVSVSTLGVGNTNESIHKAKGFASSRERVFKIMAPVSAIAEQWDGWGTQLKPSWEPILLCQKPFEGTFAQNVQKYGVGGLNIDGCRVGTEVIVSAGSKGHKVGGNSLNLSKQGSTGFGPTKVTGRWPANLIHDGSEEVVSLFPNSKDGIAIGKNASPGKNNVYAGFDGTKGNDKVGYGGEGSAARFFYCAKTSKTDRNEGTELLPLIAGGSNAAGFTQDVANGNDRNRPTTNHHPTVKPTSLMQWLCRLITPVDGVVFDPFMGSGSTGKAALLEGFSFAGCELDTELGYFAIAQARLKHAQAQVASKAP